MNLLNLLLRRKKKEEDTWKDIKKILNETKYRTPLSGNEKAIYLIDLPKAMEIIQANFKPPKRNEKSNKKT